MVKSVLQKSGMHTIGQQLIDVQAYYPAFGVSPPGHDPSKPWQTLPDPFMFPIKHRQILKFLSAKPEALERFTSIGSSNSFDICLDKSDNCGLYICSSQNDAANMPDIDSWEECCRTELENLCGGILVKRISTLTEGFPEFNKEAQKIIPEETSSIFWEADHEHSTIVFVGFENQLRPSITRLEATVKQVEEDLIRKTQSVDENIPLEEWQISLIEGKGFTDEIRRRFPKLEMQLQANKLILTGLTDEVKSAKQHWDTNIMPKMMSTRASVSDNKQRLLEKKKVRSYLESEFSRVQIVVNIDYEASESEVTIHAASDKELKLAQGIIDKAKIQKRLLLSQMKMSQY